MAPLGTLRSLFVAAVISLLMFLSGWPVSGATFSLAALLVFALALAVDVLVRDISRAHTWRSALDQYLALNVLHQLGSLFYSKMLKDTKNLAKVQEKILLEFLSANSATDYGRHFHFLDVTSREGFVRSHPLVSYADVAPFIDRMVMGETNVLTADLPKIFAVTSGTSGKTSILPFLKKQQTIFFLHGITVMSYCMMKAFPQTKNLRKGVKFFYSPRWRQSAGGIPIGPNSSSPASTKSILHLYTTPAAGYEIPTEPETLYVHLLFSLKDRELGSIEANFASLIYYAFHFLEANWKDLVSDISRGSLKESLDVPVNVRSRLNALLKPDGSRAEELRKSFEAGFEAVASRIWPKLSLVLCVDSGAFALYASVLRQKYCFGIPIYSPLYAATEGLIGLNVWPEKPQSHYLLVPRAMFFEFIRLADMDDVQPKTLFIHQVVLNEIYELVLTNASGLCRYRFGDVIRVVDFLNQCPVIEFLYRKGQLLNVRGEKLNENIFYTALDSAVRMVAPQVSLVDYTTCESVLLESVANKQSDSPHRAPHYGVFLELSTEKVLSLEFVKQMEEEIDQKLQELSFVYNSFRMKGSIGRPQVFACRSGTFLAFRQFLLLNTESSVNQVKIPRVIRKSEHSQFLLQFLQEKIL